MTPEDRTQQLADTLAAGPCEMGGDNLRSCPICLAAVAGAIREAESAAVKRAEEAESCLRDEIASRDQLVKDEAVMQKERDEARAACAEIVRAWRDFPIDRDMHHKREEIIENLRPSAVTSKRPKL